MSGTDEDAFREFEEAGAVEIGETNKGAEEPAAEKPARRGGSGKPPKPAVQEKPIEKTKEGEHPAGEETDEDGLDETDEERAAREAGDDEGGEDEEGKEKPRQRPKASDRIRDLTRRNRDQDRTITSLTARLDALEKGGLQPKTDSGKGPDIGEAPDPTDAAKYPLGHLDERYVEDRIAYGVKMAAAGQADAVLQREQETRQAETQRQAHEALLGKVDDLSAKGDALYDDFQEAVVDAGLKGDWRLEQATFEAAHEADHGAQILYELSQDKKEAARVAGLTPYGQLKFVMERDAEIAKERTPRRIPGAGAPPQTQTRGANSRTAIKPDTDNLDDFEKAWAADAKRK